jgi:hypothetical protein
MKKKFRINGNTIFYTRNSSLYFIKDFYFSVADDDLTSDNVLNPQGYQKCLDDVSKDLSSQPLPKFVFATLDVVALVFGLLIDDAVN